MKKSELRQIIKEEIKNILEADWRKELDKMESFKLGTPVTYDGDSGEVILNKQTYKHKGGGVSKPGTLKGISLYKNDNYSGPGERFVVPDSWFKVKKF